MRAGGGGGGAGVGGGEEFAAEMSELGSTWVGGRWGSGQWEQQREQQQQQQRDRPATTGMYYSPPGTSYTIVERPSTTPRGTYLGTTRKRPISPEQVLRMFGPSGGGGASHHNSTTKLTHNSARRSPASSPASTTHQVSYSSIRSPATVSAAGMGAGGMGGVSGGGYPMHELSTRTVTMVRDPPEGTHGFGICVKGGKDSGVGVYISRVEEGSVAERAGLRPGDSILEVNGTPFTGISHEEALKMLKSCRKLSMTVRSPALPYGSGVGAGGGGGPWLVRQTCSWMDRQGRPVSPPLEYARSAAVIQPPPPPPPTSQRYHGGSHSRSASKDRSIRRVDLCIEPGQSLGLMIRGGIEYNLGIFITGVDKDSVADRAGLMVGDQILEVNSQSFLDVTHDEAVGQLKYHKRMSLVVRDVGKVPHSCTAYGDGSPSGPASSAARSARRWAAALQMVEEKARVLLARPEFASLCYYTDEYAARHMDVEAYVHVVLELLNTSEKYTLVTELREIIAVEDRGRFDELVYQRPDPLRGAVPQLTRASDHHDYRHSRRKTGLQLDTGNHHSMLMSSLHEISAPKRHGSSTISVQDGVDRAEDAVAVVAAADDDYRSPSEDSGLGLAVADRAASTRVRPASAASMGGGGGWNSGGLVGKTASSDLALPNDHDLHHQDYGSGGEEVECDGGPGAGRRHSSPGGSRTGSHKDLHSCIDDFPDDATGYLGGLRNQLGGWTQRMKSWYWGRPLELAHKLSRSFDMKDESGLLDGGVDGSGMRRHQSMQRLARVDSGGLDGGSGADPAANVTLDVQGNLRVTVRKSKPILGIAIEGGANTKHPLPRIINIHEHGAAHVAGGLEVGQLILQVDGQRVDGLQHQEVARLIAEAFARPDRPDIEFTVVEAKKSNLEPKPTALIFLEA